MELRRTGRPPSSSNGDARFFETSATTANRNPPNPSTQKSKKKKNKKKEKETMKETMAPGWFLRAMKSVAEESRSILPRIPEHRQKMGAMKEHQVGV